MPATLGGLIALCLLAVHPISGFHLAGAISPSRSLIPLPLTFRNQFPRPAQDAIRFMQLNLDSHFGIAVLQYFLFSLVGSLRSCSSSSKAPASLSSVAFSASVVLWLYGALQHSSETISRIWDHVTGDRLI
jgi:hypothetical protein